MKQYLSRINDPWAQLKPYEVPNMKVMFYLYDVLAAHGVMLHPSRLEAEGAWKELHGNTGAFNSFFRTIERSWGGPPHRPTRIDAPSLMSVMILTTSSTTHPTTDT
jgi:hypothetical protein